MTAKPPPTAADSGRGGGSVEPSGLEEVQERGAREVIKLAQFQKRLPNKQTDPASSCSFKVTCVLSTKRMMPEM